MNRLCGRSRGVRLVDGPLYPLLNAAGIAILLDVGVVDRPPAANPAEERLRACGYRAHRVGVGAVNILTQGMRQGEILPGTIWVPERIRIAVPSHSKGLKA